MRRWGTEVPRASSGSLILPSPVTSLQHLLREEKQCARRQGSAHSSTNLPASFSPKAKQRDCIQLVSDITLMSTQAMCSQLIYFCPLPWLPLHSASVFTQTYPIKFWRIALQPPPLRAPACLPSPNQRAAPRDLTGGAYDLETLLLTVPSSCQLYKLIDIFPKGTKKNMRPDPVKLAPWLKTPD